MDSGADLLTTSRNPGIIFLLRGRRTTMTNITKVTVTLGGRAACRCRRLLRHQKLSIALLSRVSVGVRLILIPHHAGLTMCRGRLRPELSGARDVAGRRGLPLRVGRLRGAFALPAARGPAAGRRGRWRRGRLAIKLILYAHADGPLRPVLLSFLCLSSPSA